MPVSTTTVPGRSPVGSLGDARSEDDERTYGKSGSESVSRWNPLNPWPEIFTRAGKNFVCELCVNVLTWALEEVAISYFSEKVCDDLTKNCHKSARRKLERGQSRIEAAADMVPTAIKASILRHLASFITFSTGSIHFLK